MPSSRVITLQSPLAMAPVSAARGGQFCAHLSLHTDLPPLSLSKVYSVMPLASTSMPSLVIAGSAACAARAGSARPRASARCLQFIVNLLF